MAQSRAPRLRKSVTVQAEGIKSAAKTVKIVPKELISRRLSPGFQLKVTWLMWHKLGNRSNTKETSMSKYLEHNKHPRGDTSAKQSIHQFRVHRKLHLQSFQVEFFSQKCEESKRSKRIQKFKAQSLPCQPFCNKKKSQRFRSFFSVQASYLFFASQCTSPRGYTSVLAQSLFTTKLQACLFSMSFFT